MTFLVYINDVAIVSENSGQHVKDIHEELTVLYHTGVKLELSKSHLFLKKNESLAHILLLGSLATTFKNIGAIKAVVFPTKSTQMR